MKKVINIMGCMGIGKTTIIENIKKKYEVTVLPEQFEDNPYWQDAYAGKEPEFLKMQIEFMNQYIDNLLFVEAFEEGTIILDQCFYTLPYVWTQSALGLINEKDFNCYLRRWNLLKRLLFDKLLLLHSFILWDSSENIYKKIQDRGREEERNLPFEFINKMNLHFNSDKYLKSFVRYPVFDEVCSLSIDEIPKNIESLLKL